jgi:hypothetical protein
MPIKSAKQMKFMEAMAHGAKSKGGIGPSPAVAEEFIKKTPKKKKSMFMKKPPMMPMAKPGMMNNG